ncbi:MAG: SPOR domain-containing protein [Gammaproteobacteria bacterium]|nr:SPOR domain-containing protein [Gammaproteobacteria bacterium]
MEQTLKQRLIGAVVLVSLAVIFIPIILEGPDDEWTPRSHSLPDKPQLDYRADMELVLPPPGQVDEQPGTAEVEIEETPASGEQPVTKTVKPVAATPASAAKPVKSETTTKPPAKPPAKPAPSAPALSKTLKGWFVQVGSFGQEMNAKGLQDRLVESGFKAQLQEIEIGNKRAYRVLVGPSAARAEAEKLAASLKSGHQLKGMVVEYP